MAAKVVPIREDTIGPVESGVPIPAKSIKYPFAKMKPGDSFTAPMSLDASLRSAASQYGKRNAMTFITRIVGGRVRVWRTK
jgi:hypothetical protein